MIRVLLKPEGQSDSVVWMPNVPHTNELVQLEGNFYQVTKVIHQVVFHTSEPLAHITLRPLTPEEAST